MIRRVMWALLLAAPLVVVGPMHVKQAQACGHTLVDAYDETDKNGNVNYPVALKRAERYMNGGQYAEALSVVAQLYWELPELNGSYKTPKKIKRDAKMHNAAMVERGARIAAISIVRSGGKLTFDDYPSKTSSGKTSRLKWAVGVLGHLQGKAPDDVELRNYYAEALASQPKTKDKALEMFAALDREGLLLDEARKVRDGLLGAGDVKASEAQQVKASAEPVKKGQAARAAVALN